MRRASEVFSTATGVTVTEEGSTGRAQNLFKTLKKISHFYKKVESCPAQGRRGVSPPKPHGLLSGTSIANIPYLWVLP